MLSRIIFKNIEDDSITFVVNSKNTLFEINFELSGSNFLFKKKVFKRDNNYIFKLESIDNKEYSLKSAFNRVYDLIEIERKQSTIKLLKVLNNVQNYLISTLLSGIEKMIIYK